MSIVKVQAIREHQSGLPKDRCVNTFHFSGAGDAATVANLCTDVLHFYTTDVENDSAHTVANFLATHMTTMVCRGYVVDGPAPHPPLAETLPLNLADYAGSSLDLVSEVAVCMSYQAAPAAGQPQARRRGRLYIGPLNSLAAYTVAAQPPRPSAAITTALQHAAARLKTAATGHGADWVVYSAPFAGRDAVVRPHKSDLPALPARAGSFVPVTQVWVDNAFDTQRRRGEAATIRNLVTL